MRLAVRVECEGEAHSNIHIDNCGLCAPSWGHYYACPDCGQKLARGRRCVHPTCDSYNRRFDLPEE